MNIRKNVFLLVIITLSVIVTGIAFSKNKQLRNVKGAETYNPGPKVKATWVWESPVKMADQQIRDTIDNAKKRNITLIYLFTEDYMTIIRDQDIRSRLKRQELFNNKIQTFLNYAKEKDISVEALGGAPDWANYENKNLPITLLKYVINYNRDAKHTVKFAGVHYDLEFYGQEGFADNRKDLSINFIKLVRQLVFIKNFHRADDLQLSFDVPPWINNVQRVVPPVYYKGKTATVYEHMLAILNSTKSSIVLMSYRDHVAGSNGITQISKDCIDLAEKYKNTKILIGIETSNNGTSSTTFFGGTLAKVNEAQNQVTSYFSNKTMYSGVAIHSLSSYMKMQ